MIVSGISSIRAPSGAGPTAGVGSAAGAAPVSDFSKVMANIASDAVGAMKSGEAAAINGISGNTSVQNVVQSMMGAEEALQTALAVRDKLLSAYQEISRMTI
jgi:flagellar hook-basal body complex protein FliE